MHKTFFFPIASKPDVYTGDVAIQVNQNVYLLTEGDNFAVVQNMEDNFKLKFILLVHCIDFQSVFGKWGSR